MATDEEFVKAGVRLELVQILRKLNINTLNQLKEQTASKLLNDMGGMRKKLKLQEVQAASLEEIEGWLA
jgi:lysyl-tRNA synthetase class 2